jgi:hypothetical protein
MAGVIEVANSAYEERDKAQEKLALLMKQVERERALASGQLVKDAGGEEETVQEIDDEFKSSMGDEVSQSASQNNNG